MEKLLELADKQPTTSEVTTSEQINEELFKQFLSKSSVWDLHCYQGRSIKKNNSEKEYVVVKYYNEMLKGKIQFLLLLNYRLFVCFFFV